MPLFPGICGIIDFDDNAIAKEAVDHLKKHLSGNGERQEVIGSSFMMAQHGYNTTGREGSCVSSDNGSVIVMEGRIDNEKELVRSLGIRTYNGYASLLQLGHEQRGMDFFKDISGPFAAAMLATRRKSLRLFRDPIALRPLYYTTEGNRICFGSDVRQLLCTSTFSPSVSEEKLLETFSPVCLIDEGWSDANATMFNGIRSVPYGSYAEFNADMTPQIHRYWNPPERLKREWSSPEECAMQFRSIYAQVMAEHLDTPHGIAAELSGGIDSGCNVGIAGSLLGQDGRSLHTYTAVFKTQSENERDRVRSLYRRYPNIVGHIVDCNEQIGFLEHTALHDYRTVGHPSRQNLPATFVALAQQAREDGPRILLSGEGADWFLEGTDMIWDSIMKSCSVRELARTFSVLRHRSSTRAALHYIMQSLLPALLPGNAGRRSYLREHYESTVNEDIPRIFTNIFHKKLVEILRQQQEQLHHGKNLSCRSQTLERELMFPPNHVWQGVPVEVEMRLPYLDRRVVEFGLAVPPEYKFHIHENNVSHYGCRKFLQRTAFRDLVPEEIIRSQHKEAYGSPVNRRLVRELPSLLTQPMILCDMGVLDRYRFRDAVNAFLADRDNDTHRLIPWIDTVLGTEMWLRATTEEFPGCRLPTFHSALSHKDENGHRDLP